MRPFLLPESPHSPVFAPDYLAGTEGAVPQPFSHTWSLALETSLTLLVGRPLPNHHFQFLGDSARANKCFSSLPWAIVLAYFHNINSPTVATVKRSQNKEYPIVISSMALPEEPPPITFSNNNKQSLIYSESTSRMVFMR